MLYKISPEDYGTALSKYLNYFNDAFNLLLDVVKRSDICELDISQIITQNFYIQCALCEMLLTGNKSATISVPMSLFHADEYCMVFDEVVLYYINQDVVTFSVKKPKPKANRFMEDNSKYLHPLLQKSLSFFRERCAVDLDSQIVFMKYRPRETGACSDDLLLKTADTWQQTGFIAVPVYMPQAEIIGYPPMAQYNEYFDDLIFVGHMSNEEFVSHAMACFFDRSKKDMKISRLYMK